jgi:hypothetical protein
VRAAVGTLLVLAVGLSVASLLRDPSSAITLAIAWLYGVVGGLLAIRRPRNPIGWLFLGVLFVFTIGPAADALGGTAVRDGAPLPGGLPLGLIWIDTWVYGALFGLYYALTVVFPSGRLPAGRLGRAVRLSFAVPIAACVVGAFGPHLAGNFSAEYLGRSLDNPAALLPFPDGLQAMLEVVTIGLLVVGVVSMVVRFARARGIEREQLKWLVASLAVTGVLLVAVVSIVVAQPRVGLGIWFFALLGFATIPPAVGIAVLRYRLYEIDRIVSRTVSWTLVSAVLAAVFVSVTLLTQALLASITKTNTLAVAASTLVVAAMFQPIRSRVQARVDRRFDRVHHDAERTVATFVGRLRDEIALDQLRADINAAVILAVQPVDCSVWLRK